jgi:hypothetical protein
MDWSTVGKTLESLGLPALGALLAPVTGGASLPIAAGIAAMLGHPNPAAATPDQVNSMLMAGVQPDVMEKLKAEDNRHAEAMEVLKQKATADANAATVDMVKAQLADTVSARQREATVKDYTPRILAALIVTGYAVVQWYILKHVIVNEMMPLIMRGLGTLDAALGLVLAYYFGSSRSGDIHAQALSDIAQQAQSNNAAPPSS